MNRKKKHRRDKEKSIYLPQETKDALCGLCGLENRTIAGQIKYMVEQRLEELKRV